jgi:hypothetical protein
VEDQLARLHGTAMAKDLVCSGCEDIALINGKSAIWKVLYHQRNCGPWNLRYGGTYNVLVCILDLECRPYNSCANPQRATSYNTCYNNIETESQIAKNENFRLSSSECTILLVLECLNEHDGERQYSGGCYDSRACPS